MGIPVARVVHLHRGLAHDQQRAISAPLVVGLYTLNMLSLIGLGMLWISAVVIAMVPLDDSTQGLTALVATFGVMATVYGVATGSYQLHLLRHGLIARATPVVEGRRVSWRFTTASGHERVIVDQMPDYAKGRMNSKLAALRARAYAQPCDVIYDPPCEACAMKVTAFTLGLQISERRVTARDTLIKILGVPIAVAVASLLMIAFAA